MKSFRFFGVMAVAVLGTAAAACGSNNPSSPSAAVTLSGTYAGAASDSSGPGQMTWQVTQSGNQVSGSVSIADATTNLTASGNLSGSVSGQTLTFNINVPAGGIPAPASNCTVSVSGSAQVTTTSISGTYSGTNSCTGPISNGQVSLTKK